jgi:hypothetical protein
MKRIKMLALAMGLSVMALSANRSAADPPCRVQCQQNYDQCQAICSQNPCFVSCDTTLQSCLSSCPN